MCSFIKSVQISRKTFDHHSGPNVDTSSVGYVIVNTIVRVLHKKAISICGETIYPSLVPHSPQNLVPAGLFAPHFEHFMSARETPQLLQNFPSPAGLPH
jgi:hypothetical protein